MVTNENFSSNKSFKSYSNDLVGTDDYHFYFPHQTINLGLR